MLVFNLSRYLLRTAKLRPNQLEYPHNYSVSWISFVLPLAAKSQSPQNKNKKYLCTHSDQ